MASFWSQQTTASKMPRKFYGLTTQAFHHRQLYQSADNIADDENPAFHVKGGSQPQRSPLMRSACAPHSPSRKRTGGELWAADGRNKLNIHSGRTSHKKIPDQK
jgi:hypothetical protein